MAGPPRELLFYLDYISSNAYLAWLELPKLAARHGVRVEPVPVLFAGLLEAHGQLGPAEVRPKALWMLRNTLRKAALLGVPLNQPRFHPFNPLLALRVSSLPLPDEEHHALVGALFEAVWVRGLHVSEPEVVAGLACELGLPGEELVARARSSETKARLRKQTDDAIAAGVFGVPTMGVGGQLFWGYDDFPFLERFLAGEDPLDPKELAKWTPRGASAVRRRFQQAAAAPASSEDAVGDLRGPEVVPDSGLSALESILDDRLWEFNKQATGILDGKLLGLVVRDRSGELVAGLAGHTWGDTCKIGRVWVHEAQRGRGLGRKLLEAAIEEARRRGCRQVVLSTHSFQAPGFYRKLGFELTGERPEYPRGHSELFLRLTL